jgi:hypothetical protein
MRKFFPVGEVKFAVISISSGLKGLINSAFKERKISSLSYTPTESTFCRILTIAGKE